MSRLEGYALSPQQKAAWQAQASGHGGAVQAIFGIGGADGDRLRAALGKVLAGEQVYRLRFVPVPGGQEPVQVMTAENNISFEEHDATGYAEARTLIDGIRINTGAAEDGPLLRVLLCRIAGGEDLLVFSSSPLCADAWSICLLATNVLRAYEGREPLPEPPLDYLQFSEWQNQLLEGDEAEEGRTYWKNKLSAPNTPPEQLFASCHDGTDAPIFAYTSPIDALPGDQNAEALLGACWYLLLYKLNHDNNFLTGHVHHGRSFEQLYHLPGAFARLLPLQPAATPTQSLRSFVQQYADELNLADTHKEALDAGADEYRFAARQLPCRFEYIDLDLSTAEGDRAPELLLQSASPAKLHLQVMKKGADIQATLYYDSEAYDLTGIDYLFSSWQLLVRQCLGSGDTRINDALADTRINTYSPKDARPAADIVTLFALQVAAHGDRIALTDEEESLTYAELDRRSSLLAAWLISQGYMNGHKRVGIMQQERTHLIVSMLATLKAGGTYVPIDSNDSPKRIEHIFSDSGIGCLLSVSALQTAAGKGTPVVLLDEFSWEGTATELPARSADTPAYIIYTSGTSGLPKGVVIRDASLANYIGWLQSFAALTENDNAVLLSSYAFDLGYTALWGTLLSGGRLHLISKDHIQDMDFLVRYIAENNISFLKTTPSFFNVLLRSASASQLGTSNLRLLMLGGELINADDLQYLHTQVSDKIAVINHYGPTETTIGTIAHKIDMKALQAYRRHPVIGRPITNSAVWILDESGRPAAPGTIGEICIAGAGLAAGYLDRDELTAEKFTDHEGQRIYRTGDSGSWMPDGTILYLGRRDDQVKIRGYRVEPGEVKRALGQYPGIGQVVVTVRGEAYDKQLVAYITAAQPVEPDSIKEFMKAAVPDYMVPAHIIQLKDIPLTANHKIDYKSLPEPGTVGTMRAATPPRNEREERVAAIWRQVLNNEHIGIDDDFFDLGGHSLKAIQVVNRLQKELKIKAGIKDIFNAPTIRTFCEATLGAGEQAFQSIQAVAEQPYYPLSHAQKRFWFTSQRKSGRSVYNVPQYCLFTGPLDKGLLEKAFAHLIRRHESLRTLFKMVEGELVQVILPPDAVDFSLQEISVDGRDAATALINEEIEAPFDLEHQIPVRARLIVLGAEEHVLLFTLHHIISDGWSREIIYRELMHFYEAHYSGRTATLPPLRIQYKDYVGWHNDAYKGQEPYWADFFRQGPQLNEFPLDKKRPEALTFEGGVFSRQLDKEKLAAIKKLVGQHKLTINSLLLGAYGLLLGEYCQSDEVIVGTLVSGRNHIDLEGIVGVFINYLPFRITIDKKKEFIDYIASVNGDLGKTYQHQDYPFDLMVEKFAGRTASGRNPVFDTMMVFHEEENSILMQELPGGVQLSEYEGYSREYLSKLDFKIDATTSESGIALRLEYNRNLFEAATMERLLDRYVDLLSETVEIPARTIGESPVLMQTAASVLAAAGGKRESSLRIIASFTAEPLEEHLGWWFDTLGQPAQVSFGAYHQVFRELLAASRRRGANSSCIVLNRFEDYVQDWNDAATVETLEMVHARLERLLIEAAAAAPVILVVTPVSEDRQGAIADRIDALNERLCAAFGERDNVYLVDFRDYRQLHPGLNLFDDISYGQAYIPFTDEGFYFIAYHITRVCWALKNSSCKVIALDCDNTLWAGVCGEDGVEGIQVREGHRALQQFFIRKYNEGFLLALVSKNNERDVWQVFDNHPGMLLKKEHFVSWRINWEGKSGNLRSLAEELNVGLDSFAFIDDSPVECFQVMQEAPEVLTLELPEDDAHFEQFLRHVISFDKPRISREDAARNDMYKAEAQRNELLRETELSTFLEHLQLQMSFRRMAADELERVAQLTLRTNQFNLNGVRRSRQEIEALLAGDAFQCFVVHVRDRFGDYGLVGVVLLEEKKDELLLHSFLLSCRVLGRGIETAILGVLQSMAKERGLNGVTAAFRATAKNIPFADFLAATQWTKISEGADGEVIYQSTSAMTVDEHLQIFRNEDLPVQEKSVPAVAVNLQADRQSSIRINTGGGSEWRWKKNLVNEDNLLHRPAYRALEYGSIDYLGQLRREQLQLLAAGDEVPGDEPAATVLRLFREVLRNGRVGMHDDFFQTGGHSIKAVQLLSKVYKAFGVNISLADFFERATATLLSEEIARQQSIDSWMETSIAGDDERFDEIIL